MQMQCIPLDKSSEVLESDPRMTFPAAQGRIYPSVFPLCRPIPVVFRWFDIVIAVAQEISLQDC